MTELEMCLQDARILQGKYQDTAAALDRAHQALTRIADRHKENSTGGGCLQCWRDWPCEDYLDATGVTS